MGDLIMKELTKKQYDLYQYIIMFKNENDYCPSIREMADYFHTSIKSIVDRLNRIKSKKYIEIEPKKSRAIKILPR